MKHLSFVLVVVLALETSARAAAGYAAHEWGTFTSVQGSDGALIAWNPFTAAELPPFVHERNRTLMPGTTNRISFSKTTSGLWLQRMETPVIYFYTDEPMRVDATVDFPDGLVTEWFPRVESFGPRGEVKRSYVRWDGLDLRPATKDSERTLPMDKAGSHYFAARETDAAFVTAKPPFESGQDETEKFLFYRGVGNFKAPLHVRFEDGKLALLNRGGEELPHLFVLEVRGASARTLKIPALGGGGDIAVALPAGTGFRPLAEVRTELAGALELALVEAGLYQREAAAMVKTWEDSWFTEQGTRLLYLLPRAWTDRVLPLKLEPAPRELVRVMVGRAEIFTPELESALIQVLTEFPLLGGRPAFRQHLKKLGLGRFAEAAEIRADALVPKPQPATRPVVASVFE